jgi:hypothetical protein
VFFFLVGRVIKDVFVAAAISRSSVFINPA